jgi:hypothetical protein
MTRVGAGVCVDGGGGVNGGGVDGGAGVGKASKLITTGLGVDEERLAIGRSRGRGHRTRVSHWTRSRAPVERRPKSGRELRTGPESSSPSDPSPGKSAVRLARPLRARRWSTVGESPPGLSRATL